MNLYDIKPYIRYARHLCLDESISYPTQYGYDARFFYLKSGNVKISTEDDVFNMRHGDVIIINSCIKYSIHCPEKYADFIAFNFDYTSLHRDINYPVAPVSEKLFEPQKVIEHITFDDCPVLNRYVYLRNCGSLEHILEKTVNEYVNKQENYELKTCCMFTDILIECLRFKNASQLSGNPSLIIDYVQKNYMLPITNKSIGEEFGFHPNYISKLIKQSTGVPLHQYIMHTRLFHALELMERKTYSISEIASRCGFCDIYYFSRYFKSVMNISPLKYMNNIESTL